MKIVELKGKSLNWFLEDFGIENGDEVNEKIFTVHVWVAEDGFKYKINYGTWSPPLGEEYEG